MSDTFRKVHYPTRPAKRIERKMMSEAFRYLTVFGSLEEYQYIGFGSLYFTDFILFHKSLGIRDMISVEENWQQEERFNANRPFGGIEIVFKKSAEALRDKRVKWNAKLIAWLDYDNEPNDDVFESISYFCENAISGSVLIVSVNAHPYRPIDCRKLCGCGEPKKSRHEAFTEKFADRVPPSTPEELEATLKMDWGTAAIYRQMLVNRINDVLAARDGYHVRQIFNFNYDDGAMMLTVGFLLYDSNDKDRAEGSLFDSLSFISDRHKPETAYPIVLTNYTTREVLLMNHLIGTGNPIAVPGLTPAEIEGYEKIHRYYPTFAEAELE